MGTEIIGIDHIYLSVRSIERSEAFYDKVLLRVLGFKKSSFVLGDDAHVQYFNRLLGLVLRPARRDTGAHDPYAPGLHHLCFRVQEAVDVDRVAAELEASGVEVTGPKAFREYAPDYYAVFVNDPDGIRLEITNFREERRRRMEHWGADAG